MGLFNLCVKVEFCELFAFITDQDEEEYLRQVGSELDELRARSEARQLREGGYLGVYPVQRDISKSEVF